MDLCILYYQVLRYCYNNLFFNCKSVIFQVVAYRKLKTRESFKVLALKVISVTFERWPLTMRFQM